MNVDLLPMNKFATVNGLKEVTNPILFERGNIPTSDGLLSTDIFGVSVKERRETFAYINLKGKFFHPLIYKVLKRLNRNFEHAVHGTRKFIIVEGQLVQDDDKGDTGIDFIYKNWDKIQFNKNNSNVRNERIDLITSSKKDETVFYEKTVVIPPFYRDVNMKSGSGGKVSHHEINDKYAKLLNLARILENNLTFDFVLNSTKASIQELLVEIYDLFQVKIKKKEGLIRKSLLGKSVDYGSRSVISAPIFDANRPEELKIDTFHTGVPLSQCCTLFTPFIVHWIKRYFQKELEKSSAKYPVKMKTGELRYVKLKSPELHFNEDYIKKHVDKYIYSYADRFETIELPVENPEVIDNKKIFMHIAGGNPKDGSSIIHRKATWTDILFMAACDVTADKHIYITRYPMLDYMGTFPNEIRVMSTNKTIPVYIGGRVYEYYPLIDLEMTKDEISSYFIDTISFSNLYLAAIGGDYDGDQVSIKGAYSQEANIEADRIMKAKTNILNIKGSNVRATTNEGIQTLYNLTAFR